MESRLTAPYMLTASAKLSSQMRRVARDVMNTPNGMTPAEWVAAGRPQAKNKTNRDRVKAARKQSRSNRKKRK